jgi:hypothetical protein
VGEVYFLKKKTKNNIHKMSLGNKSLNNFLADSLLVTLYERDDILHRLHLQFRIPIIPFQKKKKKKKNSNYPSLQVIYVSEEQQ